MLDSFKKRSFFVETGPPCLCSDVEDPEALMALSLFLWLKVAELFREEILLEL